MAEVLQTFYNSVGENISIGWVSRDSVKDKKTNILFSTYTMELGFDEIELLQDWLDWVKNDYLERVNE